MRNKIISAINDLFDNNTSLTVRNEYLESLHIESLHNESNSRMCCESDTKTDLDRKVIIYAKKKLTEEVLRGWEKVKASRNDETKEIETTSFENWLERKIYDSSIPDNMSREDIKNIIYENAKEIYCKEKEEAIKTFEKKEMESESNE